MEVQTAPAVSPSHPVDAESCCQALAKLIRHRIRSCFEDGRHEEYPLPGPAGGPIGIFIRAHGLNDEEACLLLIALMPHMRPGFLDAVIQDALPASGDFPPIGGLRGQQFRGFLPTGETALFLIGGKDWWKDYSLFQRLFGSGHLFSRKRILWLEPPSDGEPIPSGKLVMNPSLVMELLTGAPYLPPFGARFPARQLTTEMEWKDLVLHPETRRLLDDLRIWLQYHKVLSEDMGMRRKLMPGYRALLYGPPGTGKTFATTLLGKECGQTVFRIDLSTTVSKYIGETEKNLARLFDEAEYKNWILFFDEADAIFGKRTQVKDAHDRYANQEVSYLMQRIESFSGLVILASNLKANIDEAFARRFQSIIFFPYPSPDEQLQIWKNAFPPKLKPDKKLDLRHLAQRYRLTGANIMNIVQYGCLQALAHKKRKIAAAWIEEGIQRELLKEGKNA